MTASGARVASALAGLGASALGLRLVRRACLRWGASDQEVLMDLPGDQLIPAADVTATRAISVSRPAADVWPWLAQLGQRQGGFYSYDGLENLFGCRIHSADRIVPAWQAIEVGYDVALAPGMDLAVAVVDKGRAVVLRGAPPLPGGASPYDFTWAFCLEDNPDGTCRLIVRERYQYTPWWAALIVEPAMAVSSFMTPQMLRGIRDRAERGNDPDPDL